MLGQDGISYEGEKIIEESRHEIAREFEKTIYILEILEIAENDEREMMLKIKENDYGLKFNDFDDLMQIATHKHGVMNESKRDTLRKMFGQ